MATIRGQVHTEFRVFAGKARKGNPIAGLAAKVEAFVTAEKIAPKSIGVEYLEATREVILSLGYRRDVSPYQISLIARPIGMLTDTKRKTLAGLEARMSEEAASLRNVICHELLVTETGELTMVFMIHQ